MLRRSSWLVSKLTRKEPMMRVANKFIFAQKMRNQIETSNHLLRVENCYSTETNRRDKISEISREETLAIQREESLAFNGTYQRILKDLSTLNDSKELAEVSRWLEKIIEYNVPHGKRNRGLALVFSYRMLSPQSEQTAESLELSRILGWCVELLQAYFLILDDLMDQSITRRGQLCWYRQDGVGLMVCNDAVLINCAIFSLLKIHFSDKPYYSYLIDLFLEMTRVTSYGQCLDLLSTPPGKKPDFASFTMERYAAIVKYKTAYYSFILPVRLAMYASGWTEKSVHQDAERILLKMGHFFQVQDDYLDCYGDPDVIGKIGTDIEDGKCSWPIVMALQTCSPEQRRILQENYACQNTDAVARVKQIYNQLDIKSQYEQYELATYNEICLLIEQMTSNSHLPSNVFYVFLDKIHKRIK